LLYLMGGCPTLRQLMESFTELSASDLVHSGLPSDLNKRCLQLVDDCRALADKASVRGLSGASVHRVCIGCCPSPFEGVHPSRYLRCAC
jgi:hypothetical protein